MSSSSGTSSSSDGSSSGSSSSVCMGGDWYTFPSHFFLPEVTFKTNTNTHSNTKSNTGRMGKTETKDNANVDSNVELELELELDEGIAVNVNETHVRYTSKPVKQIFTTGTSSSSSSSSSSIGESRKTPTTTTPTPSSTVRYVLDYVPDNFHGQLPRHYLPIDVKNIDYTDYIDYTSITTNGNSNGDSECDNDSTNDSGSDTEELTGGSSSSSSSSSRGLIFMGFKIPFILPRHPYIGTYHTESQSQSQSQSHIFNDGNREELSTYVGIEQCTYIVSTIDSKYKSILKGSSSSSSGGGTVVDLDLDLSLLPPIQSYLLNNHKMQLDSFANTDATRATGTSDNSDINTHDTYNTHIPPTDTIPNPIYDDILYTETIDSIHSPILTRAFYIPIQSYSLNHRHEIHIFRKKI